jgi:hypothetical protein
MKSEIIMRVVKMNGTELTCAVSGHSSKERKIYGGDVVTLGLEGGYWAKDYKERVDDRNNELLTFKCRNVRYWEGNSI